MVLTACLATPRLPRCGPCCCCRRQRLGMVQTRDQFVFCHTALLHFVRQLAAEAEAEEGGEQEAGAGAAAPAAAQGAHGP